MSDNDHLTGPMLSAAMDEVIRLRTARDMDLRVYAEQLEQNTTTMDMARARIEALEAALREITEGSFVTDTAYDAIRIARAALTPACLADSSRRSVAEAEAERRQEQDK